MVGTLGMDIALASIKYLGLFAYLFPLTLFFPLYHLYKDHTVTIRRVEKSLASLLLIVSILLFEALLFVFPFDSYFGVSIVRFFEPIIGTVGVVLFLIMLVCMGFFIYFDLDFDTVTSFIRSKISNINPKISSPLDDDPIITEESPYPFETVPAEEPVGKKKEDLLSSPSEEPEETYQDEYADEEIAIKRYEVEDEEEEKYKDMVKLIDADKDEFHRAIKEPMREEDFEPRLIEPEKTSNVLPEAETENTPSPMESSKPEPQPQVEQKPLELDENKLEQLIHIQEAPVTEQAEDIAEAPVAMAQNEQPAIPEETKPPKESSVIVKELEENTQLLSSIEQGELDKPKNFKLPPLDFLDAAPQKTQSVDEGEIDEKIEDLLDKLQRFKIDGDVVRTYSGPVVTTFEFRPAPNVKVSKILNLEDDLAMALKAKTIRIQAPVPGKDVVGIEIPNRNFETIYLREILESDIFKKAASPLTIALGKDIVGNPFITDLKKLPHLLIAGTTGSGKSVGINAMILSLLYRNSPENLKFLMIDPKMLEFSIYNDIPHLLTPVITQAKQAVTALSNMVSEMERRYALMSNSRTKNIESYNDKAKREGNFDELPYIVVIIDELADLMMTSGKDVEYSIARLAQMARASGIHLVVATQRPSVDVVTGLIKANLPSRISFRVGQKIDSKVILDGFGAESLLGRGDMLFTPPGIVGLVRLHAPWCSEKEIEEIVEFIKAQREPEYNEDFLSEESTVSKNSNTLNSGEDFDELFEEAKKIVLEEKKTSISYIQRRLQIGYNRSARIVEQLEAAGVLSAPNTKGNREIL